MDALGWIVAIVILLIFGRHVSLTIPASFDQPNAVPTPDGLPYDNSTQQDTTNPPSAQPPRWASTCMRPPSPSLPMQPSHAVISQVAQPVVNTSKRVTFTQYY